MSTTAEFAYQSVRQMLFDGDLRAGQRVSQLRLARALKCSKIPIVEALRRLESEGLILKEGRKMARVRTLLASEVKGLYLLRQALEVTAVELCIQEIEPQKILQLKELEGKFQQAARDRDLQRATQLDIEIHRFIVRCAKCPLFQKELDRLMLIERTVPGDVSDQSVTEKSLSGAKDTLPNCETVDQESSWKRYGQSHRGIIDAIADRDVAVAQLLMKRHIQNGYEETLQRLQVRT